MRIKSSHSQQRFVRPNSYSLESCILASMRSVVGLVVVVLALSGCSQKPSPQTDAPKSITGATQSTTTGATQGGGAANDSGNITPIGPNVGGITPVAGGENLEGGTGGGIAQAAKDRARQAASKSSTDPTAETSDQ